VTGDHNESIAPCPNSVAVAAGESSHAAAGSGAVAVALGNDCCASGEKGAWLILVERKETRTPEGTVYTPKDVKLVYVEGKEIKPNKKYVLVNGKIRSVS
jgi:hypothetical protein